MTRTSGGVLKPAEYDEDKDFQKIEVIRRSRFCTVDGLPQKNKNQSDGANFGGQQNATAFLFCKGCLAAFQQSVLDLI